MLGDYNPFKAAPGTIRGDYAVQMDRNLCHGSDSVESAKKEIAFWFDGELTNWDPVIQSYVFKDLEYDLWSSVDLKLKEAFKAKSKLNSTNV